MKKLFLVLLIFNLQSSVFNFALAQAPQAIPYQAVARDNGGNPIANQTVSLRFSIHQTSAVGTIVYQETQSKTTNSFGLFTANIGEGMVGSGTFATIEWDAGAKFMQVEMDAAGGNAYVDMGTQQMLSVPYALYAGAAGKVQVDTTPVVGENNIPSVQIPDNSCTGITSTISVSGQDVIVSTANISVRLDITHTFDADLYIYLIAPNGSVLCLASANGGSGNNFTNTIFSDAGSTNISSGSAPFTGTFNPNGSLAVRCSVTPTVSTFAAIGGGSIDPNGTWSLTIFDQAGIDVGILNSWSISISTGSTTNYIPKWNSTSSLVPSAIYDNGNVGINTEAPEASAQLEVSSTTKGFLPPRMTAAERDAISNPVAGLVVYCTNCGSDAGELEVHNGVSWRNMAGGGAASIFVPVIGQAYMGGIIAYILQPGDPGYDAAIPHGLIAAPTDQSSGSLWGCAGTLISGADGAVLGTGNQNTIDIMNGCATAGIAARICGDLVLGGYSDWFLPSKDELHKLYLSKVAIGGFTNGYYWSSTETNDPFYAWFEDFGLGGSASLVKSSLATRVRAVRVF